MWFVCAWGPAMRFVVVNRVQTDEQLREQLPQKCLFEVPTVRNCTKQGSASTQRVPNPELDPQYP